MGTAIVIGETRSGGVHPHAAGIDVGNGMHYVACGRIVIHNQCAGLSALRRTCIA